MEEDLKAAERIRTGSAKWKYMEWCRVNYSIKGSFNINSYISSRIYGTKGGKEFSLGLTWSLGDRRHEGRPLVALAAGFNFDSTYFHWFGVEPSWMIDRRFSTNVWNHLEALLMNCRKDIESVQKTVLLMTISSSSCIIRFSLTANAVADNSNVIFAMRMNSGY